jgi:cyanophycinase
MRILAAALLLFMPFSEAQAAGPLVIAGGAIADDNAAVFKALLSRRPAGRQRIFIVPAASAEPAGSGARTAALFARHGAAPTDVEVLRVAVVDDPATPENEALWTAGALTAADLARVEAAGAIWFTGGDQARIMQALLLPDGKDSPLLSAIRAAHRQGAVIGGTSAGAAALSDPMIVKGDPVAAAGGSGEPLAVGRGLGFLPSGITDQHFDMRYRLPRLLKALALRPDAGGIGYGVAEDSALIVEGDVLTAAGRGLVTIVDVRGATLAGGAGLGVQGVAIRFLADGQAITKP